MTDLTDNMETTLNPIEGIDVENISTEQKMSEAMKHQLTCDNPDHLSCQGIAAITWEATNQKEEL